MDKELLAFPFGNFKVRNSYFSQAFKLWYLKKCPSMTNWSHCLLNFLHLHVRKIGYYQKRFMTSRPCPYMVIIHVFAREFSWPSLSWTNLITNLKSSLLCTAKINDQIPWTCYDWHSYRIQKYILRLLMRSRVCKFARYVCLTVQHIARNASTHFELDRSFNWLNCEKFARYLCLTVQHVAREALTQFELDRSSFNWSNCETTLNLF